MLQALADFINSGEWTRTRIVEDRISLLSNDERRALQALLNDNVSVPRNVYYNYETQEWI